MDHACDQAIDSVLELGPTMTHVAADGDRLQRGRLTNLPIQRPGRSHRRLAHLVVREVKTLIEPLAEDDVVRLGVELETRAREQEAEEQPATVECGLGEMGARISLIDGGLGPPEELVVGKPLVGSSHEAVDRPILGVPQHHLVGQPRTEATVDDPVDRIQSLLEGVFFAVYTGWTVGA